MAARFERLTALSAFSGLGGLDLGLEAAGFEHLGCIENDEAARRSIKVNRGETWPILEPGDIATLAKVLQPDDLGIAPRQLSLLAGGPPCQPFSKAGQWSDTARQGLADVRSHCLHDFLSLVAVFLPRVVLMENVPGFVRGSLTALDEVASALREINERFGTSYVPEHRVVDAASYGVPQHRMRAIVVINRDGMKFRWPRPSHDDNPVRAWDAIGNLQQESTPSALGKWADLLPSIPEGENYLFHTRLGGGQPLFGYRTRFWSFLLKLAKDRPSWTLPAQPGPSTGPFHWNNRPLTILEMLRLQSFPADWQVEGGWREQVRQVGNATPPLLAEVFGRELATQFFKASFKGMRLRHRIARVDHVPAASNTASVPAKYRALEGNHDDHPGTGKGPKPRRPPKPAAEETA